MRKESMRIPDLYRVASLGFASFSGDIASDITHMILTGRCAGSEKASESDLTLYYWLISERISHM